MRTTIYDVAKRGGVSISTASKALNNRRDVGEKTKEKIKQIAKDLNYEPSHFARSLALKKIGNIGVIIGTSQDMCPEEYLAFLTITEGVGEKVFGNKYDMIPVVLSDKTEYSGELPNSIKNTNIDGLIVVGKISNENMELLISRGIPVVTIDSESDENTTVLHTDYEGGAYAAVIHLINTGHKKIVYTGFSNDNALYKQRFEGYKKALLQNNIEFDENLVVLKNRGSADDTNAFDFVIEQKADAVLACDDFIAILAINKLKDLGVCVPEDISVIGFDNIEMSKYYSPSITTVSIGKKEMGIKAAEMLFESIKDSGMSQKKVTFQTELIIRQSVRAR